VSSSAERWRVNNRAHKAGADVLYSQVKRQGSISYRVPLKNPASDALVFTGSRIEEDTDTADTQKNVFILESIHKVDSWLRTVSVSYERERFTVGRESGLSRLTIPSLRYNYLPGEKPGAVPTRWQFDVQLKGAYKNLLSDTTFVQSVFTSGLRYKFWDKYTLVLRSDLGTTWVEDFSFLPASLRFFTGGDQSIRGYKYKSIGPVDDAGDVVGGEHLVVGSVELQRLVYKNWDVAAFFDAGDAFNDTHIRLKKGAGVGVGWNFSLASVRLYAANAISDPDRPWRAHLIVGAQL
jgi:translocation and assembly module TamA